MNDIVRTTRSRRALASWVVAALSACSPSPPADSPAPCGPAADCDDGLVCDLPSYRCVAADRAECTAPPCREPVAELRAAPRERLDLLVVMDNSGSPTTQQPTLDAIDTLLGRLARRPGGLPDLHLGVVSTDVGTAPYTLPSCEGQGDDGALQSARRIAGCTPPDGAFIIHADGAVNYEGELADAFRCIARLGIDGCGFEQPLESMRRALDGSQPVNAGFLRDDAALLVLLSIDEDDCSASDPAIFDTAPELDALDSPLGPLSSFRCFEFGVQCAESDVRAPGPRTSCRSREGSAYLTPVAEFVDFATRLKPNPDDVAVAGIIGDPAPVAVMSTPNGPSLDESCASELGIAIPGVRLATFVHSFPTRGALGSACGGYQQTMTAIASTGLHTLGSACLTRPIRADRDCVAEILERGDNGAIDARPVPPCDSGAELPCFRIEADEALCGSFEQALHFSVDPDPERAPPDRIRLRCMLE